MTRRLFLLNGLAILAVIFNHATYPGFVAMFWWTDRYRQVATLPNYDQIGTLPYYALVAIIKLTIFAVPAFLFVSGYFIAYTARGRNSALNWRIIRVRLINLLIPYAIWSLAIFFSSWLESCLHGCKLDPLGTYLLKLATGKASGAYWYIMLLCQLYPLTLLLVPLAKTRWKLLLIIAALVQLSSQVFAYLDLFKVEMPLIFHLLSAPGAFTRFILYFVLGIVAGLHLVGFKLWLARIKWHLLVAVVIFGTLSLVEGEFIYGLNDAPARGADMALTSFIYVITFVLCFLAFDKVSIPYSNMLSQLSSKSYGIYLIHPIVLVYIPKIIYHLVPWLLGYQILLQSILIISGIGIPLLLMLFVAKSRLRGAYRYLFG